MLDLIIIGAGPYGISVAAHAVASNLSYKLLGYPMDFWENQMPQNMFIRTPHDLASFSDPEGRYTFKIPRITPNTGFAHSWIHKL
ncbi:lysine/ornithine N-monooxygenase [Paenibacillus phyllosphaerae]|uniref:Lysine/ornithine N-monooxygenase n=1 Tax=Paenibacillus phyllosphaerae TaxID=274593 RepID=A0A7W5B2L6_9BACL|nr:lysine/ornithine N-monooxygenase [Paenibacillus phyllosphaerae]